MLYGVAIYQIQNEYEDGRTRLGKLRYCADELEDISAALVCMADTQLDAHEPPGPADTVVQSATGDDWGMVNGPRRPEISTVIWFGLNG